MSRFLILGSRGFIGTCLVNSLLSENHVVFGYNRSSSGIFSQQFHELSGDFSSEEKFEQILMDFKIDSVVHLISTTTPQEQTEHIEREIIENVIPTVRLLEAMSHCGTSRILYASSGGTVYGELSEKATIFSKTDPVCSYGIQKLTIEKYLSLYRRMHGIDYRIARIANPYGITKQNSTHGIIPILVRRILSGLEVSLFGNTERDYIHVQDVVNCLKKLIGYSGNYRIFNVGSGYGVSLEELVGIIEKITNKRFVSVNRCPIRYCDVEKNILDISLTKLELQWEPEISLDVGIKDLVRQLSC